MTITTAAPVAPPAIELPSERVMRLGRELSRALDALNADIFASATGDGEVEIFTAIVWPSKVNPHVCLAAKDIPARLAHVAGVSA